jgi:hypothetical protein
MVEGINARIPAAGYKDCRPTSSSKLPRRAEQGVLMQIWRKRSVSMHDKDYRKSITLPQEDVLLCKITG